MPDIFYDCGCELNASNRTKEHVPAQNLYEGFGEEFKKNRITVPACSDCNNKYSKIDQELRDLIAVKNDSLDAMKDLTGKGVRSIFRRGNWKERVYTDENGNARSVAFDYKRLCELHIKNFKALFIENMVFPYQKSIVYPLGQKAMKPELIPFRLCMIIFELTKIGRFRVVKTYLNSS